jgi:hypothetical protein
MCYIVAKDKNKHGCFALKTNLGKHLSGMIHELNRAGAASRGIQLVTISRPTAYGEYAPYRFAKDEDEFRELVEKM